MITQKLRLQKLMLLTEANINKTPAKNYKATNKHSSPEGIRQLLDIRNKKTDEPQNRPAKNYQKTEEKSNPKELRQLLTSRKAKTNETQSKSPKNYKKTENNNKDFNQILASRKTNTTKNRNNTNEITQEKENPENENQDLFSVPLIYEKEKSNAKIEPHSLLEKLDSLIPALELEVAKFKNENNQKSALHGEKENTKSNDSHASMMKACEKSSRLPGNSNSRSDKTSDSRKNKDLSKFKSFLLSPFKSLKRAFKKNTYQPLSKSENGATLDLDE